MNRNDSNNGDYDNNDTQLFKSGKSWRTDSNSTPLADFQSIQLLAMNYVESVEDWCHRMNTSDDPEAIAFRERWRQTPSGRGENS